MITTFPPEFDSSKKKSSTITLDLSPVVLNRLKDVAEQNGRSVSAEIRFAIKRNVQNPITLEAEEAKAHSDDILEDLFRHQFFMDVAWPGWNRYDNHLVVDFNFHQRRFAKLYGVPYEDFCGMAMDLLMGLAFGLESGTPEKAGNCHSAVRVSQILREQESTKGVK